MGLFKGLETLFKGKKKTSTPQKKTLNTAAKKGNLKVVPGGKSQKNTNITDKQIIAEYQQKISKMLQNDPHAQKRAAEVLSQMINKNNKSA